MSKKEVVFILGQTATGKTSMATELARSRNGELINCDSRQIYKGLDIITGKTDNPKDIPMHMVDIMDPKERYSAYEYAIKAREIIADLHDKNILPIVVGGTGMYAYILKFFDPKRKFTPTKITNDFESSSLEDLQTKIQTEYGFIWEKLTESDKKNKRRLCGALHNIFFMTMPPLDLDSPNNLANSCDIKEIVLLHKDQDALTSRLQNRVEQRMKDGALAECRKLLENGYTRNDPGLATIGYSSIFDYLDGLTTEQYLKDRWYTKERQYAKRQKTYFSKYFPKADLILV